jgi:hypothetical protein
MIGTVMTVRQQMQCIKELRLLQDPLPAHKTIELFLVDGTNVWHFQVSTMAKLESTTLRYAML